MAFSMFPGCSKLFLVHYYEVAIGSLVASRVFWVVAMALVAKGFCLVPQPAASPTLNLLYRLIRQTKIFFHVTSNQTNIRHSVLTHLKKNAHSPTW